MPMLFFVIQLQAFRIFLKQQTDREQVCVFVATKTTTRPSACGKLAFAPDGRQRSDNHIYQLEKAAVFGADVSLGSGWIRAGLHPARKRSNGVWGLWKIAPN